MRRTPSRGDLDVPPDRLGSELAALRSRIVELESDNAHLRGLLQVSSREGQRPGAAQTAMFEAAPGSVTADSPPHAKVAFYSVLFRARPGHLAGRDAGDLPP